MVIFGSHSNSISLALEQIEHYREGDHRAYNHLLDEG
jgi:hypothetical protein